MYQSIDSAWAQTLYRLREHPHYRVGSRDGATREIIGYLFSVDAGEQRTMVQCPERKLDPCFSAAEVLWYFSANPSLKMLKRYAPNISQFYGGAVTSVGAYGPRLLGSPGAPDGIMRAVINTLKKSPDSRQAVAAVWTPGDIYGAVVHPADVPCTLNFQFLIRDKRLIMSVAMRSNDAWRGLPNDAFAFMCIQRVVAAELDVEVGEYHHHVIGSMHLYEREEELARRAIYVAVSESKPHDWALDDTISSMRDAVEVERAMREENRWEQTKFDKLGSMAKDLVRACVLKLTNWKSPWPESPAMRNLLGRRYAKETSKEPTPAEDA